MKPEGMSGQDVVGRLISRVVELFVASWGLMSVVSGFGLHAGYWAWVVVVAAVMIVVP